MHFDSRSRGRLQSAVAAWYGASGLSRNAFHNRLLDPSTSDETVDHLRAAARGLVEARDPIALRAASGELASAVNQIGLGNWPRYLGDADCRAVAAVSEGDIPGVVKADFTNATRLAIGVVGAFVLPLATMRLLSQIGRAPSVAPAPAPPMIVHQDAPEDKRETGEKADDNAADAKKRWMPPPGGVVVPEDRAKYILDGNGKGGGAHGAGRGVPGKSEFPSNWSDDRAVEEIKSVANDPSSSQVILPNGRVNVKGTRDGVDILVAIGRDGVTVVTAYPENTPRNP